MALQHLRDDQFGAIRVAESDPSIVYVSTGSDGMRSNVINGYGVYKSTDAGETWTHLGLENTGTSGAVLIHPSNPDVAFVAAIGQPFGTNPDRGVFRTTNGGITVYVPDDLQWSVRASTVPPTFSRRTLPP